MEGVYYRNGHRLPKEIIISTLKSIGCNDIKDNDYIRLSVDTDSFREKKDKLIPDFICTFNRKECAVEIGNLSDYSGKNRIGRLLGNFRYVIHIFSDKKYYLLHCILHERKVKISERFKDFLLKQRELMNEIILDNEEEELL